MNHKYCDYYFEDVEEKKTIVEKFQLLSSFNPCGKSMRDNVRNYFNQLVGCQLLNTGYRFSENSGATTLEYKIDIQ